MLPAAERLLALVPAARSLRPRAAVAVKSERRSVGLKSRSLWTTDEGAGRRRMRRQMPPFALMEAAMKHSIWKRYGYAWVTLALFLITLSGHWVFGWFAYVQEQQDHGKTIEVAGYTIQMMRDTLENWQSEFLQLLWQVAGLAILLHVGSPQSKEGDDRMEAKIDAILLAVDPQKGDRLLDEIDREYEGRHTDARFVRLLERGKDQPHAHAQAKE